MIVTGYHGWHDWYIGSTARHLGVPEAVRSLVETVPFGDLPRLADASIVTRSRWRAWSVSRWARRAPGLDC